MADPDSDATTGPAAGPGETGPAAGDRTELSNAVVALTDEDVDVPTRRRMLGRLVRVQEGTKAPTTLSYYEPSGLPQTVTLPAPGGAGSGAVSTSLSYDSLGNVVSITAPEQSSPRDDSTRTTEPRMPFGSRVTAPRTTAWASDEARSRGRRAS